MRVRWQRMTNLNLGGEREGCLASHSMGYTPQQVQNEWRGYLLCLPVSEEGAEEA